jgi:hypothetical protein
MMVAELVPLKDLHKMDPVFGQVSFDDHEQIVFCNDKDTGLKAIIGIHNRVLGPALGGTRMWNYTNEWEALNDVLRLSRGMTFKSAVAGLNLGGGKAVIIGDAKTQKTPELMRKFGEFVHSLSGKYITAEDVKSLINLLFQTRLATLRCDLDARIPYIRCEKGDDSLFDFISQNIPSRKENPQLYNNYLQFKTRNSKKDILEFTFNQDDAFDNKLVEFISSTHPLSQAAFRYFKTENTVKNNAFFFCIDKINVPVSLSNNLIYILAKYNMESLKYTIAKPDPDKNIFDLQLLFILNENGEFLLLSDDETNQLLAIDNKYWYINTNEIPYQEECSDIIDLFTPVLMHNFYLKKRELEDDLKNVHSSRQYRLIDTEIDFLNRQIERDSKTLIEDSENAIRFIFQNRVEKYRIKINELENQRSKIKLELHEALQSISIIKII